MNENMDGLLLLGKRDNVHCRNKLNSLKRYTFLKITKFSPSIQVKGR